MSDPTEALVLTGWRWYCRRAGLAGIAGWFESRRPWWTACGACKGRGRTA